MQKWKSFGTLLLVMLVEKIAGKILDCFHLPLLNPLTDFQIITPKIHF